MTAAVLVALLDVPLLGVLFCVSPVLSRPTLQFGVRIPGDRAAMPVVRGERRAFYWRTAAVAACCTIAAVVLAGRGSVWSIRAVQLAEILADLGCFGLARNRIAAAKSSGGWFAGRRQVVTADTTWRTSPARFPVGWLLPAVAVIVATAITGALRAPSRQVPRPPLGVLGPVAGQLYVTVMWTVLLLFIYRSRPDLDVADPGTSARQYRRFLAAVTRAILLMIALIDLTMLLAALRRWQLSSMPAAVTTLPFLVGFVVLIVVSGRAGQGGSRLGGGGAGAARPAPAHVAPRDDDRFWKGGLLYVNRDDPAIMVASRFGVGWTFNFGNRLAWLVVAGIVAGPAGLLVIRAVAGL